MKTILILIATTVAIIFSSCSKSEEIGGEQSGEFISFESERVVGTTKGAIDRTNSNWKLNDQFGIYAAEGELGAFTPTVAETKFYMDNVAVKNSADNDLSPKWGYDGAQYVYPGRNLSFVAYFPHSSTADVYSTPPSVADKKLVLPFKMAAEVNNQVDLLWGTVKGQSKGTASITFKHALAMLSFNVKTKVRYAGGATLKSIKVFNAATTGVATISIGETSTIDWTPATDGLTNYFALSSDVAVDDQLQPLLNSNLLLIPKSVKGTTDATDCKVRVTYTLATSAKVLTADLALTHNWKAGSKYEYTIIITAKTVEFGPPTISQWEDGTTRGDFAVEYIPTI